MHGGIRSHEYGGSATAPFPVSGIIVVMSKTNSRRFPVTVTQLPVMRCQVCKRTVAYRPGKASEVLTEHYRRVHPERLGLSPK
jgi:hypothetical protein